MISVDTMKQFEYVIIINTASRGVTKQFVLDVQAHVATHSAPHKTKILFTHGADMPNALHRAEKIYPKYIIACGGDGTVRSVAELAYKNKIVFGTIPAGTLNHFAKTVGLPQKTSDALDVLYFKHQIMLIDVGMVNGNIFVNNSSVGMYSKLVIKREQWQQKFSKPVALVMSAIWQIFHISRTHYIVKNDSLRIDGKFSLIMVGNGVYKYTKGTFGRSTLNGDKLSLYLFGGTNIYQVFRSLIHLISGKKYKHRVFTHKNLTELTLITSKKQLSVALDGEVQQMASPISYKIEHDALKILAPK